MKIPLTEEEQVEYVRRKLLNDFPDCRLVRDTHEVTPDIWKQGLKVLESRELRDITGKQGINYLFTHEYHVYLVPLDEIVKYNNTQEEG